jgi:5-methylcytosine-specific restriction protein A
MATFLCTWNPDTTEWDEKEIERDAAITDAGGRVPFRWAVGIRRGGICPDDRVFMVRQRHERGIVASGQFTSEAYEGRHWNDPRRTTMYADMEWDTVLHHEDRLPVEVLKRNLPGVVWDRLQGSGVQVKPPHDAKLERAWSDHLGNEPYKKPDELLGEEGYAEGAVRRVEVNRYERDRRARQKCIAIHGCSCAVCSLDFSKVYGEIGVGFIEVHHLVPLANVTKGYKVDPRKDLRPVCPNCHAMLHKKPGGVPFTVKELQARLTKQAR